jgi:hypothetical protein
LSEYCVFRGKLIEFALIPSIVRVFRIAIDHNLLSDTSSVFRMIALRIDRSGGCPIQASGEFCWGLPLSINGRTRCDVPRSIFAGVPPPECYILKTPRLALNIAASTLLIEYITIKKIINNVIKSE